MCLRYREGNHFLFSFSPGPTKIRVRCGWVSLPARNWSETHRSGKHAAQQQRRRRPDCENGKVVRGVFPSHADMKVPYIVHRINSV